MTSDRTFIAAEVDTYDDAASVEATVTHDLAHPRRSLGPTPAAPASRKTTRDQWTSRGALPHVMDGILYVLRTGCQWKALPREYGSASTCHRRFQAWVESGIFERLWGKLLTRYNDLRGIQWRWQSLDSAMVKAPLGGRKPAPIRRTAASSVRSATR